MPFTLLRWSIALVLGGGAALLMVTRMQAGRSGVLLVIGAWELIAAVLFVVPRTMRAGGFALLGVLAAAAGLHVAVGERPPISFVVYAAAIWAVIAERTRAGTVGS
jgi:hypothetical protein